jgi:RND family efflux transporter MFP subunit
MKIINLIERNKILLILVLAIITALVLVFSAGEYPPTEKLIAMIKGEVSGEEQSGNKGGVYPEVELLNILDFQSNNVSVKLTGSVESLNQVNVKSELMSKVRNINFGIGDFTSRGSVLIKLEDEDLLSQKNQILNQINSAEVSLSIAKANLENTERKAKIDLENLYSSAVNTLSSAVELNKNSLFLLTDLQYAYFNENNQKGIEIANKKGDAIYSLFGDKNGERMANIIIGKKTGGTYGFVKNLNQNSHEDVEKALVEVENSLIEMREALNSIPTTDPKLRGSDLANLAAEKNSIYSQISAVSGIRQGINLQKTVNQSLITSAESGVSQASSALTSAENSLDSINLQLEKTNIKSPIYGEIATLNINEGEIVSPGQVLLSIVNKNALEVKTFVDSKDVSLIKEGNKVFIEDVIEGYVKSIAPSVNPATKKVEVTVAIINSTRPDLVIGQFVNIDILKNKNDLSEEKYKIPLSALKVTSEGNFVYYLNEENVIEEKPVSLEKVIGDFAQISEGINPNMEIIKSVSGLNPGEKVNPK